MNRSTFFMSLVNILGGLILFTLLAQPTYAQGNETLLLQQKIDALELRIKQLEEQLRVCVEIREQVAAGESGWQNKKNWRKLEIGMAEVDVRSILGEPTKVIEGVKTLWYYPNFYKGFVSFDQTGKLTGWNEP